jgi:oligopeptide transport system substrate-binding protein
MKKLLVVLLSLLMILSLAGCGSKQEESSSKKIVVGVSYDASTIDAANSLDDGSGFVVRLITEPLLRFVESSVTPGLAETWESNEDGTVWTFHLRESKFQDGSDVTANDVAYAIIRTLTPENGLGNASDSNINTIKNAAAFIEGTCTADDLGINVVDDYTLELTYEADTPATEDYFGDTVFAPVKQSNVEELGIAYGSDENLIGNGPFMISKWTRDSEIVLVKNPNYWNADAIKLDEIDAIVGATAETGVDMMLTDKLDAATYSDVKKINTILEDGGFSTLNVAGSAQFLHMNASGKTEETGKWLGNLNFRKALSAAIDREKYVEAVYPTHTPATSVVPGTEVGVEDLFNNEYDTGSWSSTADEEAAKQYLQAAMDELGVTSVEDIPTFTMLAMDSTGNVDALNLIADQWKKVLGISCALDMQPMMGMLGKVMTGDFDFWKGGGSIEIDTLDIMGDYTTEDGYYGFNDEEFDALYKAALATSTKKDRKDALAALATYFTDNMMDLELTWSGETLVYSDKFTGIAVNNGNVDYTYADIAE